MYFKLFCNWTFIKAGVVYRFEYKPKKVKVEHDKKAKKRKHEYEDDEEEEVYQFNEPCWVALTKPHIKSCTLCLLGY